MNNKNKEFTNYSKLGTRMGSNQSQQRLISSNFGSERNLLGGFKPYEKYQSNNHLRIHLGNKMESPARQGVPCFDPQPHWYLHEQNEQIISCNQLSFEKRLNPIMFLISLSEST